MTTNEKQYQAESVNQQVDDPDTTDVSPYIPRRRADDPDATDVSPYVPKRRDDKNPVAVRGTEKGRVRKWPFRHDDIANGVATLGSYTLLGVLGGGGTSTVFSAESSEGQLVAIKMLHGDQTLKEAVATQRFAQEYNILRELDHDNITAVYDMGFTPDHMYIVMEKLSNHDLGYRISCGLSRDLKFLYARQILSAMIYMGNHGVIHRDLKPSNILFRDDSTAVVTDFGAAKLIDHGNDSSITLSGVVIGTLTYSSPEQISSGELDMRSDQYSFGVLLYELLSDRRIFLGHKAEDIAHKHLHEVPEKLPEEYEFLQPVLDRLLDKSQEKRFSCFEEVRDIFEGYIEVNS